MFSINMNKILFSVGALIAGCFTLTSCSGGSEGNSEQSVGAMSGRTFVFGAPSSTTGSMFIQVGDRIGGQVCEAKFWFGKHGSASSRGTVTVEKTTRDGKNGWKTCDFTFHIYEGEISQEVEFKTFFAIFLAEAGTTTNTDTEDGEDGGQQNTNNSIGADDYVSGIAPTRIRMTFDNNRAGSYIMEETTVYLNDEEAPIQYFIPEGDFIVEQ